jgi:tetratricopeptide (TPR) repeat protein
MDRFLEAYFAADVPVQKYLAARRTDEDEDIGALAVLRVRCLSELLRRTPKERQDRYKGLLKSAQELVTEKFAGFGEDTVYGVARQKMGSASRMLAGGDRGGAEALYADAMATFRKIGEKDAKYRMAQVSIGECLVTMGKHQEGLQHLAAYLSARTEDAAKDAPVPDRQAYGWATYWSGEAHHLLKAPEKVIEVFADFEERFQGAQLDAFVPRVRFLRVQNFAASNRVAEAEAQAEVLRKESPDHVRTPDAALVVANELIQAAAKKAAGGDAKGAEAQKRKALGWYDFWLQRTGSPTADNFTRIGEFHSDVGNIEKAAEYWTKALEMYTKAGNSKDAETLTVYLAGLLVDAGRYAEALPKFEILFVKTPEDITPLREVFEQLKRRPSNIAAPVHEENLKKVMAEVERAIAKDPSPAIAGQAADVKKAAASGLDVEMLVRAFVDKPEQRRALASAAVESILGFNAAMPPDLRAAVFNLVNRRPDLMSKLARCYQELAGADARNPIRAVNLYAALIESAQDDFTEPRKAGSKYSERWFDWKLNWAKVYLATGTQHKAEVWLRVVCDIVKAMTTLKENELAEKARAGSWKAFEEVRDTADQELRKLGKDGCK